MVERHRWRERGQVVCAHVSDSLEPGGELDEHGLAERRSEEADAHRHAKRHARRYLNDGITFRSRQTRGAVDEVIAVQQVGGLGGVVGGADHRVEIELAQRGVDSVDSEVLVLGERLFVGRSAEGRLRIVGSRRQRSAELPKILIKERHLLTCVGIVESDAVVQGLARQGNAHARVEVSLNVISEIEAKYQGFVVGWRERETRGVEVR